MTDLSKQISNMGLDLKKRLSKVNLQIVDWIEAGIVFRYPTLPQKTCSNGKPIFQN